MSFCVPDYKVERPNENDDNDHHIFDSRRKKPSWHGQREGDDLVELLWQNGQVVMQSQNQRSNKKPYLSKHQQQKDLDAQASSEDLFIQEDEMAAWLHYPIDYESFDTDFFPSTVAPPSTSRISQVSQTPEDRRPTDHEKQQIPPAARKPAVSPSELEKSMQVSRTKARVESTIVDSSETPAGLTAPPPATEEEQGREVVTCDVTVTSSSGGSEEPSAKLSATDNRKRKAREVEDDDCNSEDVGLDSADTKKHAHVSTFVRRSRAAEVHNLSERRRRDRINEKMKALQELIPRCNKSDKASMLDEAIEYLKSLQLQVQMMSMGSCMLPMGFPSVQQYMSPMLMGMGMGMGMDAGLSHPMLPFPSVLAGSSMPTPAAVPTHLGPRLSMPAFHIPPLSSTDLPRTQAASQPDTTINSIRAQNTSLLQVPNFNDPYQHYLGLHRMQVPPCPPRMTVPYQGPVGSENPATAQQNTSKGVDNLEDNKSR